MSNGEPVEPDKPVADMPAEESDVSTMDYFWRAVSGIAPGATLDDLKYLKIALPASTEDNIRWNLAVYYPKPPALRGPKKISYKGDALVDELNRIARRPYDVNDASGIDVRNELMQLSRQSGQALALFKELKRVGFYGTTEISNVALNNQGYGATDELAMTKFLDWSNQNFKTWQAALPLLYGLSSVPGTGGPKYTGPSTEDVAAYLHEASLALTGRKLSRDVLKRAIERVIAEDRAIVSGGKDPANTGLLAEAEVRKTDPARVAAYGLGNAMRAAFQYLGE